MATKSCDLPVMKAHCKTCPFKPIDGKWQDVDLANKVVERTLFKAHQICHGTEGEGREARNRCKGAFDNNFEIYSRLGFEDLVK
jgi:hypothetical protein